MTPDAGVGRVRTRARSGPVARARHASPIGCAGATGSVRGRPGGAAAGQGRGGLDQRRLALAAGTARTTVVAYETAAEQVRTYVRRPVYCLVGFVSIRFVEQLPVGVLPLLLDGRTVPVLPLGEVRRAHAPLAELLDRHEHREAQARLRRTV